MKNNKVIVIGIDAASFDLIRPWVDQGKLQNLKYLVDNGCAGILESTIPPLSPVAWTSFYTGVNPGKHGIFDFFEKTSDDHRIRIVNRSKCQAMPIWWYLNQAGYKTGMVNIPMTYPPDDVNGCMISGLDTPSIKNEFTFPATLKGEIMGSVGSYIIELDHNPRLMENPEMYVKELINIIDIREKTVRYLTNKYTFDFFMVVFTAADRIQHSFWKFIDKDHPYYSNEFEDAIFRIYKRIDEAVGRIIAPLDDSTDIIVMSDHGMCSVHKTVNINRWLMENDYLHLKNETSASKLKDIFRRSKRRFFNTGEMILWDHFIDWTRTRAFYVGSWGNISINLKGRFPGGIVNPGDEYELLRNDIIKKIEQLCDSETGQPVLKSVLKREDIYTGNYVKDAPDLILIWNEKYNGLKPTQERLRGKGSTDIIKISDTFCGDHSPNGIVIVKSLVVKRGSTIKAKITDICPTILYMTGLPVPESMDGKVLTEIFHEDLVKMRPIQYCQDRYQSGFKDQSIYSGNDVRKVENRLKDLGYF